MTILWAQVSSSSRSHIFWEPPLLAQVDIKLFEIIPNFQILQDKGEKTFNYNNKWKSLWLLNFQCTTILDFSEMLWLRLLFGQ